MDGKILIRNTSGSLSEIGDDRSLPVSANGLTQFGRDFLNATQAGQAPLVAAQPGWSVRVLSAVLVSTAANTVKFQSSSTDISASFPLGSNGGMALPYNPEGWFQTAQGASLNFSQSAGTATGVQVVWAKA